MRRQSQAGTGRVQPKDPESGSQLVLFLSCQLHKKGMIVMPVHHDGRCRARHTPHRASPAGLWSCR
jgi:hypothetical protein